MNEISFTVTSFEHGGLNTNGEPYANSIVVRSDMIEIPPGIQKVTSVPEIWRKKWDSENERYDITQSESSSISNTIYFYKKNGDTSECLGYLSAKNVEVDFMTTRILGATHIRFTAGIGSSTIRPDDSTETKTSYYFITSINVNGTILKWYYDNVRLIHDDMLSAPEKAMKKPYPHALWRANTNIPYHELFPIEKLCGAFMNAVKLEYVRIPESVREIGRYSFFNTILKKVRISSECEYYETSFPEKCAVEFYEENGNEAVSGQTYDSDGHILTDADGARIYTKR